MNRSLKAVLAFFMLLAIFLTLMSLSGNALVFYPTGDVGKNKTYPFGEFTLGEGAWDAYVILGQQDYEGTRGEIKSKGGKVLRTNNPNLLADLKKLKFRWRGEIGTPPDNVVLLRMNGNVIFSASILLEKGYVGIQSRHFGFVVPDNELEFVRIFSEFERSYAPLVIL